MKKSNRSTAAAPTILKGTTLAGSAVAQQPKSGRLKFIESPEFGAGYLIVGDDMMVGMQKTFLDNLQESHVTQLEDGTFRVDLKETRVGLRLTRDELDFLLSHRDTQSAFRIDSSFDAAASADAAPAGKQARGKGAAKTGAAKTGAAKTGSAKSGTAKSTAAKVSVTAPVTAETAPKAPKAKAAKPAKAPKAPKAGKTSATEAAAVETAPKTTAKGKKATGAKTAAPAPAAQGSEPVSLAAHRSKRQAAQKAAGKGQAELPGLTPAEPLRRAARNANNDQRIKEPKFVSEGAASSSAKSSAAPGNGRRKAAGSDASAPAPSGRGKGKTAARSNARTSLKAGTATTVESSDATPSSGGKGQAKATRGKAGTTKAQGTGKATTAKAARGSAEVSGTKSPTAKGSARSTGAKAASGTATASEGVATTGQVKDAVREILTSLNRPVPRQELLTLVEQKLSARVPGKKPVDNLVTMLYKDPDQGFENIKSRGFWLKGQAVPQA